MNTSDILKHITMVNKGTPANYPQFNKLQKPKGLVEDVPRIDDAMMTVDGNVIYTGNTHLHAQELAENRFGKFADRKAVNDPARFQRYTTSMPNTEQPENPERYYRNSGSSYYEPIDRKDLNISMPTPKPLGYDILPVGMKRPSLGMSSTRNSVVRSTRTEGGSLERNPESANVQYIRSLPKSNESETSGLTIAETERLKGPVAIKTSEGGTRVTAENRKEGLIDPYKGVGEIGPRPVVKGRIYGGAIAREIYRSKRNEAIKKLIDKGKAKPEQLDKPLTKEEEEMVLAHLPDIDEKNIKDVFYGLRGIKRRFGPIHRLDCPIRSIIDPLIPIAGSGLTPAKLKKFREEIYNLGTIMDTFLKNYRGVGIKGGTFPSLQDKKGVKNTYNEAVKVLKKDYGITIPPAAPTISTEFPDLERKRWTNMTNERIELMNQTLQQVADKLASKLKIKQKLNPELFIVHPPYNPTRRANVSHYDTYLTNARRKFILNLELIERQMKDLERIKPEHQEVIEEGLKKLFKDLDPSKTNRERILKGIINSIPGRNDQMLARHFLNDLIDSNLTEGRYPPYNIFLRLVRAFYQLLGQPERAAELTQQIEDAEAEERTTEALRDTTATTTITEETTEEDKGKEAEAPKTEETTEEAKGKDPEDQTTTTTTRSEDPEEQRITIEGDEIDLPYRAAFFASLAPRQQNIIRNMEPAEREKLMEMREDDRMEEINRLLGDEPTTIEEDLIRQQAKFEEAIKNTDPTVLEMVGRQGEQPLFSDQTQAYIDVEKGDSPYARPNPKYNPKRPPSRAERAWMPSWLARIKGLASESKRKLGTIWNAAKTGQISPGRAALYALGALSSVALGKIGLDGIKILYDKLLTSFGALPKSGTELSPDEAAKIVSNDMALIADQMGEEGPPDDEGPHDDEGPPDQMGEEGSTEKETTVNVPSPTQALTPSSPGVNAIFNALRSIVSKDGIGGAMKYIFDMMANPATRRYVKQLLWYICNNPEAVADLFGVPLPDVKALCGIVDELESMIPTQAPMKADVETIPQRREEYKKDKEALAKREVIREERIGDLPQYEAHVYSEQAFPAPNFILASDPRHPANKNKTIIKTIGAGFKKAPMKSLK